MQKAECLAIGYVNPCNNHRFSLSEIGASVDYGAEEQMTSIMFSKDQSNACVGRSL